MTLIVTVILTKVRIYRFLTITQIPDQVRNDGTAVVIPELNSGQALTKVRICVLRILITILNQVQNDVNRGCHSDESTWRESSL